MKWRFLYMFIYFLVSKININAQVEKIMIRGLVISEDSLLVDEYSVKVLHPKSNRLLGYKFFFKNKPFEIGISCSDCDTIRIVVTCHAYDTLDKKVSIKNGIEIFERITLTKSPQSLEEVKVYSRTIWHSGDTTFFNVNRFKNNNEATLEEIIQKLPGFYLDKNGNLWYRNARIEIIRIEGEELFAEKIGILLKNLPADALETIQAIENQAENELLKGFSGDNKTILNISLKKGKLNLIVGGSEYNIGWDEKLRYRFNPVLLELKGKLKKGYIGQLNNLGEMLSISDYWQLFNSEIISAQSMMLPSSSLFRMPNIEEKEYLRNSRVDQRLQLNLSASKNLRLKMEATFFKDKIEQISASLSETQLTDRLLKRSTFGKATDKPLLMALKYMLDSRLSKNSSLQANINMYLDKGKTIKEEELFQNDSVYFQKNKTANNRNGIFGEFNIYSKFNNKRALIFSMDFGINQFDQTGNAQSESWKEIFSSQSNQYDHLSVELKNSQFYFKSGLKWLGSKNRNSTDYSLLLLHRKINLLSNISLAGYQPDVPLFPLNEISGSGNYKYTEINSGTVYRKFIFNIPFGLTFNYGLSFFTVTEPIGKRQRAFSNYLFKISQENKFSPVLKGDGEIGITREARDLLEINHEIYPRTLNYFRKQTSDIYMTNRFFIRYSFSFILKKQKEINFIGIYSRNAYTNIVRPDNTTILFYSRDSFAKKPSDYLTVAVRYYLPVSKNSPGIRISFDATHSQHYLAMADKFVKANHININQKIEIEKQLSKSMRLILKSNVEKIYNLISGSTGLGTLKNGIFRLNNQLGINASLNKETNLSSDLAVLHPDISLRKRYAFWNISFHRKIITQKIQIGIKLLNIINQKEFISINRYSPGNFYNSYLKLNGRTFLLTAHYVF